MQLDLDGQEFEENMQLLDRLAQACNPVGLAILKLERAKLLVCQARSPNEFNQAKLLLEEAAANQQEYDPGNQDLELEIKLELADLFVDCLGKPGDAETLVAAIHARGLVTDPVRRLANLQKKLGKATEGLATLEGVLGLLARN